jgi:hypothetical protein
MKMKLLLQLCLFAYSLGSSHAQNVTQVPVALSKWLQEMTNLSKASNYQSVTNWGETNCECQLSIGLDADIVRAGSSHVFSSWIKNSSTNNISLALERKRDFCLTYLTNNFGKTYPIMLPQVIDAPFTSRNDANPGEFIVGKSRVIFTDDIEPGDYVIKPLTRDIITADGKTNTLTSNSLKVKIVK